MKSIEEKHKKTELKMKDYTFNPGDFVVYPAHGVGQVTARTKTTVAGQDMDLLAITFEKDKLTMHIPCTDATNKGLRQIATPAIMETVQNILSIKTKTKRIPWSKRQTEYTTKISSGDPISLAEVVRELYRAPEASSTYSERQIYEKALGRLAPEYAVINNITEAEAVSKIEAILQSCVSAK